MHLKDALLSCIKLLAILQLALASDACSRGVTIAMDDKVPPSFTFKRNFDENDYVPMFYVSEVASENLTVPYTKQTRENKLIWQIVPTTSTDGEIKQLLPITYGIVPPRFTQKIPEKGLPPSLVEGKVYEAGGPSSQMHKGFTRFIIQDGKAIRVPIPGQEP